MYKQTMMKNDLHLKRNFTLIYVLELEKAPTLLQKVAQWATL